MIGNSHIDPVWFWDWEEGMQEVKATFSSALDRMEEYPEMTFTATSTAFFEWIEKISPQMFEKIKKRVKEGRFLLTGGWFVEPDCMVPCGEAFVRQGLYGQRYFREKFGTICHTASNVDSFGHTQMLPQILKKSGFTQYVFMRPRLDTPIFLWESPDGSRLPVFSLQSEYTTWFYESTKEAIQMAGGAAKKAGLHGIPCCYGVGNHGGGPTKKNLEAVQQLRGELPEYELVFSGYDAFFEQLTREEKDALPVRKEIFDRINTGCYSMDGILKKKNRIAEKRLRLAEFMGAMEQAFTGKTDTKSVVMKELWKILLFNQFHDTLGGTTVKEARDEALRQLDEVSVRCKRLWVFSMQNMVNFCDTKGEGFPFFLFNPNGTEFDGYVEAELNWFCKAPLLLLDEKGEEVEYQRCYTQAKVRNYNLGGRRAIVFHAKIPAAGFVVYRTVPDFPEKAWEARNCPEFLLEKHGGSYGKQDPCVLENKWICARFDKAGNLYSLVDKTSGYEALKGKLHFPVWIDERDTWGGMQERRYENAGEELEAAEMELVESGTVRKVVRVKYQKEENQVSALFILNKDSRELEVRMDVFWNRPWHMLRMSLPVQENEKITLLDLGEQGGKKPSVESTGNCAKMTVSAECAYGTNTHIPENGKEYNMHRFVDVYDREKRGLYVANNEKYCYVSEDGCLEIPLARAAIFAQGSGKNWYNPVEGYTYADLGMQHLTFSLVPHGTALLPAERYELAERLEKDYLYLADNIHDGKTWKNVETPARESFFNVQMNMGENTEETSRPVKLMAVKPGEEESSLILRLLEVNGQNVEGKLEILGEGYPFVIGPYEILSLCYDWKEKQLKTVNLLEDD